MERVGAFEAKTHFSALLDKVEHGEEILITKHGRAVAKLSPATPQEPDRIEAVNSLKAFQDSHSLILALDWKTLRDEGRR